MHLGFFFPEEEWPQPCQGKERSDPHCCPLRALYHLSPSFHSPSLGFPVVTCRCSTAAVTPTPRCTPATRVPPVPTALGQSQARCCPSRCAPGRTSAQDEPYQVAEEHSQETATQTLLQKYLGKAAEQALNQNTRLTVKQKAPISFMNYLTACMREMKYTHKPSPNH